MLILTIRTDKPKAELGLYEDGRQLTYLTWQADRQLAETIHLKIAEILKTTKRSLSDLEAVLIFKGPGSFTGLRIGFSVANALANNKNIPIVASQGDDWLEHGTSALAGGANQTVALPEYGALPNITQPRK